MGVKQPTDAGRAGTILFVDDEPLSLKYFKASVGKYANVVTADTPEAALKILEAEGDAISVVVSDERMPRDSGVSFLSNVRKSWPSTVHILTSAYVNIDLEQAINGVAERSSRASISVPARRTRKAIRASIRNSGLGLIDGTLRYPITELRNR